MCGNNRGLHLPLLVRKIQGFRGGGDGTQCAKGRYAIRTNPVTRRHHFLLLKC